MKHLAFSNLSYINKVDRSHIMSRTLYFKEPPQNYSPMNLFINLEIDRNALLTNTQLAYLIGLA